MNIILQEKIEEVKMEPSPPKPELKPKPKMCVPSYITLIIFLHLKYLNFTEALFKTFRNSLV